jgi:hypothetical protein
MKYCKRNRRQTHIKSDRSSSQVYIHNNITPVSHWCKQRSLPSFCYNPYTHLLLLLFSWTFSYTLSGFGYSFPKTFLRRLRLPTYYITIQIRFINLLSSIFFYILGVSPVNLLIDFYDIHKRKGEVLFFCFVSNHTRLKIIIQSYYYVVYKTKKFLNQFAQLRIMQFYYCRLSNKSKSSVTMLIAMKRSFPLLFDNGASNCTIHNGIVLTLQFICFFLLLL